MSEEEIKSVKRNSPSILVPVALFFLILGAAIAAGGVYTFAVKYPDVLGLTTIITQEEVDRKLLAVVGKIIDIPKDEVPTITTVIDGEIPKIEIPFKNAVPGDKIISYIKSKRVILFRPSENKIIDVGFITASPNPTTTPVATAVPLAKMMKVFILNGTNMVGATKSIESILEEKYTNIEIVGRTVANKTDYQDTLVVDLSGNRGEEAQKIAQDLGVEVGKFPEGETTPANTDVLIIIGAKGAQATASATPAPHN